MKAQIRRMKQHKGRRNEQRTTTTSNPSTAMGSGSVCVLAAQLSPLREDTREVDFVCSTDSIDSYGEIVRQNWRLERFNNNPVALFSHQSWELPIGQWTNVRVENGRLVGTLKIGSAKSNPLAENVFNCIQEGTLRAVSVGFYPHSVSCETINGREVCVLDDNELFEISPTPVPANAECLTELKQRAKAAYRAKATANPPLLRTKGTTVPTTDTGTKNKEVDGEDEEESPPSSTDKNINDEIDAAASAKEGDDYDDQEEEEVVEAAAAKAKVDVPRKSKSSGSASTKASNEARYKAERDELRIQNAALKDRIGVLKAKNAELGEALVDMQLDPLVGVHIAPAERAGHKAIGVLFAKQGDVGKKKWSEHLEGLKGRTTLHHLGHSVIPKERTAPTTQSHARTRGSPLMDAINAEATKMLSGDN